MLVPEKKTLHNLATPNFIFIMKIKTLSCKNPNQPVVEKTFSCQDQEINKKHKLSDKTHDGIMITSDSQSNMFIVVFATTSTEVMASKNLPAEGKG